MPGKKATIRICSQGHHYYKSSDCLACPVCEQQRKPTEGFLSGLAAPARRALEGKGIKTEKQLSRFTEREIMALHGMGRTSIPKLKEALARQGLTFKT